MNLWARLKLSLPRYLIFSSFRPCGGTSELIDTLPLTSFLVLLRPHLHLRPSPGVMPGTFTSISTTARVLPTSAWLGALLLASAVGLDPADERAVEDPDRAFDGSATTESREKRMSGVRKFTFATLLLTGSRPA